MSNRIGQPVYNVEATVTVTPMPKFLWVKPYWRASVTLSPCDEWSNCRSYVTAATEEEAAEKGRLLAERLVAERIASLPHKVAVVKETA